jgi:hypothetical protein
METLCVSIQKAVDRKFVIHGYENFKFYIKSKFHVKIYIISTICRFIEIGQFVRLCYFQKYGAKCYNYSN